MPQQEVHIMPPPMVVKAATIALAALALWGFASSVKTFKEFRFVGSGTTATNTITVSGTGEVFAVPNLATFDVTVDESAKTVGDAQKTATTKINTIIDYFKQQGIADKDIKTTDYNVNPKYEWQQGAVCTPNIPCPPGKQVLTGYEVSQTVEVKVRDTSKAGNLLSGVGGRGASNVSGLTFTTDDQNKLEADARQKAITDAENKAQVLASQLGVSLVRIVGFNDNSGGYRPPIMYAAKSADMGMGGMEAPTPHIPAGQNKITSDVSITYEIQ